MYLCFLSHYYLELQHGDKAMKVLEGVLHIFPNSQIATSQVLTHYPFLPPSPSLSASIALPSSPTLASPFSCSPPSLPSYHLCLIRWWEGVSSDCLHTPDIPVNAATPTVRVTLYLRCNSSTGPIYVYVCLHTFTISSLLSSSIQTCLLMFLLTHLFLPQHV